MEYFIFFILASVICTGFMNEKFLYKPSTFPYSKCKQTHDDVVCEPLDIVKDDTENLKNGGKSDEETEHSTRVEIRSGHKELTSPFYFAVKTGPDTYDYKIDMMRSVTVSKAEIGFNSIISEKLRWACAFYRDHDIKLRKCDIVERYTKNGIVYLYFRNLFGRFILLILSGYSKPESLKFFTVDPKTLGGSCNEDLGMGDGSIRDFQLSASSWSRHHVPSDARPSRPGWCHNTSDQTPWIMVDLIAVTMVEGVHQYNPNCNFNIYAGTDIHNMNLVLEENKNTSMIRMFKPVKARYIKLEFVSSVPASCFRLELRGCKLSGVPILNCSNTSEMFELSSTITTEKEIVTRNISNNDICNNMCLQNDNCSVVSYNDEEDCVQYMPSYLDNWQVGTRRTGNWSAKLCAKDPVELLPTFREEGGIIFSNVATIKSTAVVTTIGYPFSYGSGQEYKWIIKLVKTRFITIIFTDVSFDTNKNRASEARPSCNRLFLSNYVNTTTKGKEVDDNFNGRKVVIETGESMLILTFTSCVSEEVITARGFRALVTEEEIPACLSVDSKKPWKEGRHDICNKPEMVLTTMSILNIPFVKEDRWDINAGEHHSVQIKILDFYVICGNDASYSIFKVTDFPNKFIFCNTDRPPDIYDSKNSDVSIIFRQNKDPGVGKMRREGVRLRYKAISHLFENFVDIKESTSKVCSKTFDKCYNVVSSLVSWREADAVCWRNNQQLVAVQSKSELHFIHYLLRGKSYHENRLDATERDSYHTKIIAHIGLSHLIDEQRKTRYVWLNTSPITFSAWRPGNPTNADCTRTVFQYFNTDNTWESEHCTEGLAQYFVCETQMEERKDLIKSDTRNEEVCGLNRTHVNVTYSGKTCQNWDALTSNAAEDYRARFGNLPLPTTALNHCKDPSLDGIMWCYTTDQNMLREPCFLQHTVLFTLIEPIEHENIDIIRSKIVHQYQCDDKTIIPQINSCDGIFDCPDFSDEMYCKNVIGDHFLVDSKKGNSNQNLHIRLEIGSYYRCLSKEWISIIARCDGFIDCLDASDELDCIRLGGECSGNEFTCADGSCVHVSQVCDFISDCSNAEDEFCEFRPCETDEFRCDNKQCIPNSKRCNAIPDCIDKSDELSCELCRDSFHCDLNKCIQSRLRCDRFPDCKHGSDEMSCSHGKLSSCEEWWELGYRQSGQYMIDDIAVHCDFSSLSTVSRIITMSIPNIDVSLEHNGTLFTLDSDNSKLLLNEQKPNGNRFKDMILRHNYECFLKVKQSCHVPESLASTFDDPLKEHMYAYCQCLIETLKVENNIQMGRADISYRNVSEINFNRLDLTRCRGKTISDRAISLHRGFPETYYTFNNTESVHVDRRILQQEIPVEITALPITCSYEYAGFKLHEQFHCKGDNKLIPKSMICVYDTDSSGYMVGCRSGNHLENCGNFTCPISTVKCPNSYCIPQRFVCDGTIQCPKGEDEKDCTCTDFGREILVLTEGALPQSDINKAVVALARQLYTSGSIIRLLRYNATMKSERFPADMKLLEISEEHILPFEAVERKRECQYKSIARNVLQSIKFSKRKVKGIVFIEDSDMSSTVAEKMFSNLTKPAFTIYRVFKKLNLVHRSLDRYTYVNDIPVNKWKSLFSVGYKLFPKICKAGLQVPCAGDYRCSSSKQCLPLEQLCDGIVHCVNGDDERLCDFKCPGKCKCDGQEIKCRSAGLTEFDIREVKINTRGGDFSQNPGIRKVLHTNILRFPFMLRLNVSWCKIETISSDAFSHLYNLRSLDIGHNEFKELPEHVFSQLYHLTELNLDGNHELTVISSSAFHGLKSIQRLRISGTKIKRIASETFSGLQLKCINISNNEIEEIEDLAFNNISVEYIDFKGNDIIKFNKLIFKDVKSLRELRTPAFKFCCIRPCYMDENDCYPAKNEFSSCGDLMRHPILQAMLWIVGIVALLGNFGSIFYRFVYDRARLKIGYGIFVTNLAAADFLMGVYLLIIATVDSLYRKRYDSSMYIYMDDQWRNSTLCVTAGILSMVSSEASVLFLCLITLDRLLVIKYPFGTIRFLPRQANACCCISWVIAVVLAVIPVFYTNYFENKFYSRSGVCVALPLTRDKPPGWVYSVAIFVGLNFCTFILVACGQLFIFLELRKTTGGLVKTQKSRKRDLQVARNLILIATTDFLCWFPIGLMGILALSGHPISGDVYAWTAVFILPLNSALNPVLYTLTAIFGKKSFNPSTEEQSRIEVQKEIGCGIVMYQQISRSVWITHDPSAEFQSVEDILKQQERAISVVTVAAFARQLTKFLRLLHESCVGLEQLNEANTFISIVKKKKQKMIIFIDSKTAISTDKRLIKNNIYQYGVLLRKLITKYNEQD